MLNSVTKQVKDLLRAFSSARGSGTVLLIGCSTSEIMGKKKGSLSNIDLAFGILETVESFVLHRGISLAVLCQDGSVLMLRKQAARLGINSLSPLPRETGCFANAFIQSGDVITALGVTPTIGLDIGGYGTDKFFTTAPFKSQKVGNTTGITLRR